MSEFTYSTADDCIAIVGMAGRFPGADSIAAFWDNLCEGKESITFFSDEELLDAGVRPHLVNDPHYVKAKGVLQGIESFDAAFFGYTPREAEIMDPQQRIFLETAWQALENAGYDPERYSGRIGLFASTSMNTYLAAIKEQVRDVDEFQLMLSNDKDYLATRVSYKLNLKGPSLTVQTACSSSLVAVSLACQSLLTYQSDMVLAGGISITVPNMVGYLHQEGGIGSPDGHCRAFSTQAQGAVFSNGVGIVVLKRLEDALEEGDRIYALILGSAMNNDGSAKVGYTAPGVLGQARVITEALALAEVEADSVSYVEAHGTGTALGDPIEVAALTQAFRRQTQRSGFCALGSLKSNIGHLDAAAGVAGLIKTALALYYHQLPPTLHAEQPNPVLDLENTPFYLNTRLRPWSQGLAPRRAGVSAFGVGGTNVHLILQEPPEVTPQLVEQTRQGLLAAPLPGSEEKHWHLLPISARTPSALQQQAAQLAEHLQNNPELSLTDVAYTLQVGRYSFPLRSFLLAADLPEAIARLQHIAQENSPPSIARETQPPIAFLFPGGGAQHALMGRDLWRSDAFFRSQLEACASLFAPWLGQELSALLTDATTLSVAEQQFRLRYTRWGLPALFCLEYALAQRWLSWGIRPQALLGHSLGEYVAACLAGVFSLQDAATLVMQRALLFEHLPAGAMLSVNLSEEEVLACLPPELSLAACNAPHVCVVSGTQAAIESFARNMRAQGQECQSLPIEVAAHSQQIDAILDPFVRQVQQFHLQAPQIPFISNVTGTWITAEQATDPAYWGCHLRQQVRFAAGIRSLVEREDFLLLEVGPGRTLSRLARQTLSSLEMEGERSFSSMRHTSQVQDDCQTLLSTLGQLWAAGIPLPEALQPPGEQRRRVSLPDYPFERQRYWIEHRRRDIPTAKSHEQRMLANAGTLADWFYLPSWKRSLPLSLSAGMSPDGRWLIFLDRFGLASALAGRLRQLGTQVYSVSAGPQFALLDEQACQIDMSNPEDYRRLASHLQERGYLPQYLLHGCSLGGAQSPYSDIHSFQQAQRRGYYSLLWWLQAWEQSGLLAQEPNLFVNILTDRLHSILPQDICSPEQAPLLALCRVLQQEYLSLTTRCLDLVLPVDNAIQEWEQNPLLAQVLAELINSEYKLNVAYRGSQRWLPCFEPIQRPELQPAEQMLRQRGVYVLTGGLGRISRFLAAYLARSYQARLVLLVRMALPPRTRWKDWLAQHDVNERIRICIEHVLQIEEAGAEVLIVQADVSVPAQVQQAIKNVRARFGTLHGVFHTAGITQGPAFSSPLKDLTVALVEEQFAPKVAGIYALEEALKEQPLDFCLLFSSNATVLGGIGLGAYAAANAFMDAFVASRERIPWISATWDAWPLAHEEEARGITLAQTSMALYALQEKEALEAVERVLALRAGKQIVVSAGALEPRLHLWVERAGLRTTPFAPEQPSEEQQESETTASRQLHPRPWLRTAYVAPEGEVELQLVTIWQEVLGIGGLGTYDNFFELGGDSVLGLQIIARALRGELPLTIGQLFQHQTITELAHEIQVLQQSQNTPIEIFTAMQCTSISQEELEAVIAEFDR